MVKIFECKRNEDGENVRTRELSGEEYAKAFEYVKGRGPYEGIELELDERDLVDHAGYFNIKAKEFKKSEAVKHFSIDLDADHSEQGITETENGISFDDYRLPLFRVRKLIAHGSQAAVYELEPLFLSYVDVERFKPCSDLLQMPDKAVLKYYFDEPLDFTTTVKNLNRFYNPNDPVCVYSGEEACFIENYVLEDLTRAYPSAFLKLYGWALGIKVNADENENSLFSFNGVVLEHFDGKSLEKRLKEGSMNFDKEKTAVELLRKVFAIYTMGRIHRDVSPKNILVNDAGYPHIVDFSTAGGMWLCKEKGGFVEKAVLGEIDEMIESGRDEYRYVPSLNLFLGGRLFAPPESYKGRIHKYHDAWSLGAVLFAMFTGRHLVPIDFTDEIDLSAPFNRERKREYSRFLTKVARDKRKLKKLGKIARERIFDSDEIPGRFKEPFAGITEMDCDKRMYIRKAMKSLGIEPYKPATKSGFKMHISHTINLFKL